jgi:hypothetical protein
MGVTLGDASPFPSHLRGAYVVKKLVAKAYISYGPYACERVPITGQDRMGLPGHLAEADERVFFPLAAPVAQHDTISRIDTNQRWTVLFAPVIGDKIEAYVKRVVAPAAGTL